MKHQIPVLRPPVLRSCSPKPDNPWDWWIVPASQTLPAVMPGSSVECLIPVPVLIYFWMCWPKSAVWNWRFLGGCLAMNHDALLCWWNHTVQFMDSPKFQITLAFRKGKNNYLWFRLSSCLKTAKSLHRWTSAIPYLLMVIYSSRVTWRSYLCICF